MAKYLLSSCSRLLSSHQVITLNPSTAHLPRLLASLGMSPLGVPRPPGGGATLVVMLNGRIVGEVLPEKAKALVDELRTLKALGREEVCAKLCSSYF